jgi:hypothetical protein
MSYSVPPEKKQSIDQGRTAFLAALCKCLSGDARWLIHDLIKFGVNRYWNSVDGRMARARSNTWKPHDFRSGEDVAANRDSLGAATQKVTWRTVG